MKMIIVDAGFLLADLAVARFLLGVWRSGKADLFMLLLYGSFLVYGLALYLASRQDAVKAGFERFQAAHPGRLFRIRLGHVVALLALPILLFTGSMNKGGRGDEWLLTISFLLIPALTIFTLVMAARDPKGGRGISRGRTLVLRLLFFWAFAFFGTVVLAAGGDLAFSLGRELAGKAGAELFTLLVLLLVRVAFVGMVFVPMRLWTGQAAALSWLERLSFWVTVGLILGNGVLFWGNPAITG